MAVVYSKMVSKNDPVYGKIDTPVRMVLEHESNLHEKRKSITKSLYNMAKSKKFAETYLGQDEFDIFSEVREGQGGENDSISLTYKKIITHHTFMKEFTITKEMVEDSNFGIASDTESKARAFVRAYYKTRNKLAEYALINATKEKMSFAKGVYDLTAQDEKPLFYKEHPYTGTKVTGTQTNRFCVNIDAEDFTKTDNVEAMIGELSVKLANFRDDNGEVTGYSPDTIIVPGNSYKLLSAFKKVAGSEFTTGSNNNDANLQYGNWDIIPLYDWHPDTPKFMLMSREANKNLRGNEFFDRVPLTVNNWVDGHTSNLIWAGRARFGLGFANWKHILLCEQGENAECTELEI